MENTFGEIIQKEIEEEYKKNSQIVTCLNNLEKEIEPEEYLRSPLNIDEKEKFAMFDLINIKLKYMKEDFVNYKSLHTFYIKTFEFLFLKKSELNYDKLDEKCAFMQIIFDGFKKKEKTAKESAYIDKISKNYGIYSELIYLITINFHVLGFLFCGYIEFSDSKNQIVTFLIDVLRLYYKFDVKFDLNDLENISNDNLAKSFIKLLNDDLTNYFILVIENNYINYKMMNSEETENAINEELIEEKSFEQEELNKKKEKKGDKLKEDKKSEKTGKEEKKEKKEKAKISKKKKEKQKEEKSKKGEEPNNNDINISINDKSEIENYGSLIKEEPKITSEMNQKKTEYNMEKTDTKDMSNPQNQDISKELNKKNEMKTIAELQEKFDALEKENNKKHKRTKKLLNDIEIKLKKVENELNLIQARDALKAFIDLFFTVCVPQDLSYEDRVMQIFLEFDSLRGKKKYDYSIIDDTKIMLNNCLKKLKLGNYFAHKIDLKNSVINQIFDIIDPEQKYNNIKKKISDSPANTLISKLIEVRYLYS